MDPDLTAIADLFTGSFLRSDAAAIGLHDRTLRRLVRSQQVHRANWGGYLIGDAGSQPVARLQLALRQHPDCCLTHQSALLAHGLTTTGLALSQLHLARLPGAAIGRMRTRRADVRPHVLPPGAVITHPQGLTTVDPATAVVQVAAAGHLVAAVAAADQALREGRMPLAELVTRGEQWGRRPGAGRVVRLAGLVDPQAESPGETRTRLLAGSLGYRLESQVWIRSARNRYRVDLLDEQLPVIIEFDGRVKYTDSSLLVQEKAREDDLRALGYSFARLGWADVMTPSRGRRILEQAYALAAGRPTGHPGRMEAPPW